jgi:hypothetical protein
MKRLLIGVLTLGGLAGVALLSISIFVPGQQADPDYRPSITSPAFASRGPAVCFDEGHHNVHGVTDTFRPFASLLSADGFRVLRSRARFDAPTLAGCRVLVVVNAAGAPRYRIYGLNLPVPDSRRREDPAFSEEEIASVLRWVRAGGALLLAADHFPLGQSSAPLAAAFGVSMSGGFTEGSNRDPSGNDPTQLVYSTANRLLGCHPLLFGRSQAERVHRVVTYTGQSLLSQRGSALLNLPNDATDHVPAEDRFTPTAATGRSQGVALSIGRGRVVVLGEAALLTAQINEDGTYGFRPDNDNEQFTLNVMHWLTGLY